MNILYISCGPALTDDLQMREMYIWLSKHFVGSIITSSYTLRRDRIHRFQLFGYRYYRGNAVIRNLSSIMHSLYIASKLYYSKDKFDLIISRSPLIEGLIAIIIGKLSSTKVIIEVNGNFFSSFRYDGGGRLNRLAKKMKDLFARRLMTFVLNKADGIKLLYPTQIKETRIESRHKIIACFHDFTPLKLFSSNAVDKHYILFLGFPWLLKGVDILIQAFNKVSDEFPGYKLKVVGWCPEGREYFEKLASKNSNIELCGPVFYKDVIELINHCTFLVLPSRTEAMGRVLLEAMAARKAIVASNVDGIPTYVKHGYNGLLFESENIGDLAAMMKRLLSDHVYREYLAINGFKYVSSNLSEQSFIDKYYELIKRVLGSS
jgi:glycosyltransferase involved in cell wall biosynthesis